MSDSLNATVIVSVFALTISANAELEPDELELDELEPPRLPAVAPAPPVELEDELLELFDADDVEPADTESPGTSPCKDTIVPLIGAYSFVFASAASALCTFAWALRTLASAVATLPAEEVPLLVEPVEPVGLVPPLEPVVGAAVVTVTVLVALGAEVPEGAVPAWLVEDFAAGLVLV